MSAHVGLAAAAVVLWLVALVADRAGLAWLAFAVLVAVAALGTSMLLRTRSSPVQVPTAVVVVHGVAAAAALVLVLLAAATF